jgi:hypothetical protein
MERMSESVPLMREALDCADSFLSFLQAQLPISAFWENFGN